MFQLMNLWWQCWTRRTGRLCSLHAVSSLTSWLMMTRERRWNVWEASESKLWFKWPLPCSESLLDPTPGTGVRPPPFCYVSDCAKYLKNYWANQHQFLVEPFPLTQGGKHWIFKKNCPGVRGSGGGWVKFWPNDERWRKILSGYL